ncbi:Hypothetical protein DIP0081 [Corynebacterium diphtheriae]|uniref:Uncharacterized protein n=1 Tax=Corynebacterium diphtheriae (strain ATCC 700971 / NCTC 13129 / Biotype gravis) TaxID=257309 RepID=Q6NKE9_CORDI|nr:Hypothetical protein DIP0081 [Corynebacterium diphtheriae]
MARSRNGSTIVGRKSLVPRRRNRLALKHCLTVWVFVRGRNGELCRPTKLPDFSGDDVHG